jgi:hypothetical protein
MGYGLVFILYDCDSRCATGISMHRFCTGTKNAPVSAKCDAARVDSRGEGDYELLV